MENKKKTRRISKMKDDTKTFLIGVGVPVLMIIVGVSILFFGVLNYSSEPSFPTCNFTIAKNRTNRVLQGGEVVFLNGSENKYPIITKEKVGLRGIMSYELKPNEYGEVLLGCK